MPRSSSPIWFCSVPQSTARIQSGPISPRTPTKIESTPTSPASSPWGKIVFTCQPSRTRDLNHICIVNSDSSGLRQLTNDDASDHFYASLAPDGQTIVFSSNITGEYEIYEMDLRGNYTRLTSLGDSYAPAISPDGNQIAFTHIREGSGIWLMGRDGDNPQPITDFTSWNALDPVWSPSGKQILFASDRPNTLELHTVSIDGSDMRQVTQSSGMFGGDGRIRGRSDWSPDGSTIASYIGDTWNWEIFTIGIGGGNPRLITNGGNNLAPSFSPDGSWIVFTSYQDHYGESWGCEIYIMRVDGTDVRPLTNNNYCDWQPRWGP